MPNKRTFNEFIVSPWASLLSCAAGISFGWLYGEHSGNKTVESIVSLDFSIIIAIVLCTAVELFLRIFLLQNIKDKLSDLDASVNMAFEHTRGYSALTNKLLQLSQTEKMLYYVGNSTVKHFVDNFQVSNRRRHMRLTGKDLTIFAFKVFWEKLISIQKERDSSSPIVVYITHVDDIDLYSTNSTGLELLDQQSTFLDNGGEVYRVLIETKQEDRSISQYVSVLERMTKAGAVVTYMNTAHTKDGFAKGMSRGHDKSCA